MSIIDICDVLFYIPITAIIASIFLQCIGCNVKIVEIVALYSTISVPVIEFIFCMIFYMQNYNNIPVKLKHVILYFFSTLS